MIIMSMSIDSSTSSHKICLMSDLSATMHKVLKLKNNTRQNLICHQCLFFLPILKKPMLQEILVGMNTTTVGNFRDETPPGRNDVSLHIPFARTGPFDMDFEGSTFTSLTFLTFLSWTCSTLGQ